MNHLHVVPKPLGCAHVPALRSYFFFLLVNSIFSNFFVYQLTFQRVGACMYVCMYPCGWYMCTCVIVCVYVPPYGCGMCVRTHVGGMCTCVMAIYYGGEMRNFGFRLKFRVYQAFKFMVFFFVPVRCVRAPPKSHQYS